MEKRIKRFKIVLVDDILYTLMDEEGITYTFKLEFYDTDIPGIDDYIYMNEYMLSERNSILSFGLLDDTCGKKVSLQDKEDVIIVVSKDKEIYLKRLYG